MPTGLIKLAPAWQGCLASEETGGSDWIATPAFAGMTRKTRSINEYPSPWRIQTCSRAAVGTGSRLAPGCREKNVGDGAKNILTGSYFFAIYRASRRNGNTRRPRIAPRSAFAAHRFIQATGYCGWPARKAPIRKLGFGTQRFRASISLRYRNKHCQALQSTPLAFGTRWAWSRASCSIFIRASARNGLISTQRSPFSTSSSP